MYNINVLVSFKFFDYTIYVERKRQKGAAAQV